jgi:hypothetical protein
MEEPIKTPETFLLDYGIELQKTTLISYIDQAMRQPSLSFLMNEYAKYRVEHEKRKSLNLKI